MAIDGNNPSEMQGRKFKEVKTVDKRDERNTKKLPFQVHTVMNQKEINRVLSGFPCLWSGIKKGSLCVI